jgi:alginate O-acetyltransferase complex protein AlgI
MLFNSLEYGLFLPTFVAVYFLSPPGWRALVLLGGSYGFYASWNPRFLLLIGALTLVNYTLGLFLQPSHGRRRHGGWLALAVGMNLVVLGFYKYTAFLLANAQRGLTLIHLPVQLPRPEIALPLAISFFTFEFVHYVVDVWLGHPPERSLLKFAIFAAFFPTQVAGPIKRYQNFIPQLAAACGFDWARVTEGLGHILRGLFKKMVLADRLAPVVARGFQDGAAIRAALNPLDAWLAVLAFAMQVYFDFCGYTDIARGSATILGFSVPENFRRPYLALSISEFWGRWHISLSTWLRDYLFVPLGGLRGRAYLALLITMGLGGLWHGASWTLVVWGLFHGALLSGHWAVRARAARRRREPPTVTLPGIVLRWFATFGLVILGYVFFRASEVIGALRMLAAMFGRHLGAAPLIPPDQRFFVVAVVVGCLFVELGLELRDRGVVRALRTVSSLIEVPVEVLRPVGYALLLAVIIVFQYADRVPFVYFRF